ncbi:SGNH/GDSL hydrolase family protein [Nitrosopumilus sp. S6]
MVSSIFWQEFRSCLLKESDIYDDHNLKKKICLDWYEIILFHEPYLRIEPNQNFETININSLGFRGPEFDPSNLENNYRIFLVGGSTTFGIGSTMDDTTIPGYLENILDSEFSNKKIEVINAGIPGAHSKFESYLIQNHLLDFQPDMIIVYDGWNDLVQSTTTFETEIISNTDTQDKSLEETINVFIRKNFPFYKTPLALNYLLIAFTTNEEKTAYENNIEQMTLEWSKRWENTCGYLKENDVKSVIILQPFLGTGDKKFSDSELELYKKLSDMEGKIEPYEKYASVLPNLHNSCDEVLDFRMIFDGKINSIYYDHVHVGDEGNYVIAKELSTHVTPLINNN